MTEERKDAMGFHVDSVLGNFKHLSSERQRLYHDNQREYDLSRKSMEGWASAGFTSIPGQNIEIGNSGHNEDAGKFKYLGTKEV